MFTFRGDMWHGVCREENSERKEGEEDAYRGDAFGELLERATELRARFPENCLAMSSSFSKSSGFSGRRGDNDDEKVPEGYR